MAEKIRLDHLLVQRGLADSGSQAQALIMAWQVRVDGQVVSKPGTRVQVDAPVEVQAGLPYVSRGGQKLAGALDAFHLSVNDAICADVGASTGGFTDCLLQRGAARVYAIDVGYGQLAWKLRQDSRVINMERTNARTLETLPEAVDVVTVDASFISLGLILPAVVGWLKAQAAVIPLVKPQFEAGREQVGKGGVVRDADVHRQVLQSVVDSAASVGLWCRSGIRSPLIGPAGNIEFLLHLCRQPPHGDVDVVTLLDELVRPSDTTEETSGCQHIEDLEDNAGK